LFDLRHPDTAGKITNKNKCFLFLENIVSGFVLRVILHRFPPLTSLLKKRITSSQSTRFLRKLCGISSFANGLLKRRTQNQGSKPGDSELYFYPALLYPRPLYQPSSIGWVKVIGKNIFFSLSRYFFCLCELYGHRNDDLRACAGRPRVSSSSSSSSSLCVRITFRRPSSHRASFILCVVSSPFHISDPVCDSCL